MAYTKNPTWVDGEGFTLIEAAELNNIEDGIYTAHTQTINAQTGTTYTLVAADASGLVTCTNAAAITVTLPQDSDAAIAVGSRVDVAVLGAGMVTFVAGTGATANGTPSLVTRAQWSAATCIKRAANTWLVVGDLA